MYLCTINIIDMNEVYLNRIRVVLADKQITNHWLAKQLGVTDMTVSRWTTNKNQPSTSQLINISKILDVDLKELLEPFVQTTITK